MPSQTEAWQEFNDAQQKYQDAVAKQQLAQERYLPPGEPRTPHSPVQLPNPLPVKFIEAFSAIDRLVLETRERYARAVNLVHEE